MSLRYIYLYNDDGVSTESLRQTVYTLSDIAPAYKLQCINAQEIIKETWTKNAALFVMPGGADIPYAKKLNGAGNRTIKKYIENGGSYLGICAGAYYASSFIRFDAGGPLEVIGKRELAFFLGEAIGPVLATYDYHTNSGARAALLYLNREVIKNSNFNEIAFYYNGGAYFKNTSLYDNVNVLAFYKRNNSMLPAILKIKYKNGIVILSAVHFEYSYKLFTLNDKYLLKIAPVLHKYEEASIAFATLMLTMLGIEQTEHIRPRPAALDLNSLRPLQ
ncbi:BPL-N domain-containing protein [Candidatus Cardinium hertigii]|jgi:biotin--protein ligase|uniref:Biotin--protein ligase n=1 Tax=Candidatus Cardinium hertigii TaxID=247481 RepID=A0A3N2QCX8_9BACT|nr:BPL-N domain-containing protein [Candidatus Cardinium hertigii]ROT47621.1 biotin--protein ligase [Candidatus Cardinium hertigii]